MHCREKNHVVGISGGKPDDENEAKRDDENSLMLLPGNIQRQINQKFCIKNNFNLNSLNLRKGVINNGIIEFTSQSLAAKK